MPLPSPIFGQWPIAEPIAAEPIAAIFEGTFSAIGSEHKLRSIAGSAVEDRIGRAVAAARAGDPARSVAGQRDSTGSASGSQALLTKKGDVWKLGSGLPALPCE